MKRILFFTFLLIVPAALAAALPHDQKDQKQKECGACHRLSVQEAGKILGELGEVKDVRVSPVVGLFQVTVENKERQRAVVHLDFGKKHIIAGPVFDIKTLKASLAEQPAPTPPPAKVSVDRIPLANSVVMGNPEGKKKLFVFTDPDCPYCGKLHLELVKLVYNEPELGVFIKLYPLQMHPEAFDKSRVILGAENPLFMLDKAFANEPLPAPGPGDPAHPVEETRKLAESLGVSATPTLILPDGRLILGYKTAEDLRKLLVGGEKPK